MESDMSLKNEGGKAGMTPHTIEKFTFLVYGEEYGLDVPFKFKGEELISLIQEISKRESEDT